MIMKSNGSSERLREEREYDWKEKLNGQLVALEKLTQKLVARQLGSE